MSAMGKEASLDGLEFDGETVLCRVCGDKASGFHYGVHACEGCKGFFRRSIQQKIQYRPCLKNQQCNIMRVNRNRCQYCRLKKCISVGMSRDAVRFGRVPKKEKARIMEQMQKVNSQSVSTVLSEILENESDLVHTVVSSHKLTNEFTRERVQRLRQEAFQRNDFMTCPAHMACPLNVNATTDANDNKQRWEEFSEYFTPAIKCVVDFAKAIPGFQMLSQDDQVTLLKAGTFEVLLLRFVSLFDPSTNTMLFTNGKLFRRQQASGSGNAGFLLDSMFDFADRFSKLNLTEEELALFSAIILLAPDRPGLRNIEQVERIQNKLTQALQNMINSIHMDDSTLFAKLLMKTTDLRTLNTLHSEKLIGPQSKDAERLTDPLFAVKQEHVPMETEAPANDMMLNYSSAPSAAPLTIPARPGVDLPLGTSSVPVVPQRMPMEGNSHQKLVLQTPYGTFYREEVSGFYGYLPDQPRPRCHTLDRETMSRPSRSLHVIDEGNRRRYTLDKEYISKMVNKLSHKLEKRAAINDDYNPPSVSSSVCSSPVPDDQYNRLGMGSTPDSSACSSRTSPVPGKDRYSPGSPNPRSRSGSMAEKDYEIRRRCYSFHLNSEGRAARNLHPTAHPMENDRLLLDTIQPPYSADTRRGSVGASYGLHRHEKALLIERGGAHLLQNPDAFYRGIGKRPFKTNVDDAPKFQKVQSTGLSATAPTLSAQLAASPLDKSSSPSVSPAKAEGAKLAWMSPDRGRAVENITPPDSGRTPTEGETSAAKPPDTKIVVSDFSSGVVHKKFDKFRKTSPQPPHVMEKEKSDMAAAVASASCSSASVMASASSAGTSTAQGHSRNSGTPEGPKPSAAQAHPQLMAHLQAPPPTVIPPFTAISSSQPPKTSSQNASFAQLTSEPQVVMATANPHPALGSSSRAPNLQDGGRSLSEEEEKNWRDQVHQTTMLSLKDKLLKKIDSMDNLTKINNGSGDKPVAKTGTVMKPAAPTSTAVPTTAVLTTQPPHTMYAPSPVYSRQIPIYPPYYGLQYPGMPNMMLPQGAYPQAVPGMPHLAQMYSSSMPHLRQTGQPLNLSKSLEDLSPKMKSASQPNAGCPVENGIRVVKVENSPGLRSPRQSPSEEMTVS